MHRQPYLDIRQRLDQLLHGRDGDERVAACPAWTVRQVIAHLTGLCEDWIDHRIEGYASDAWTAAQVERFADHDLDAILDRWAVVAPTLVELDDDPAMGPPARWAFGDAVTHEADVRATLGVERVPVDAVALSLKGSIARWREHLAEASLPTLLVRAVDAREWWIGTHGDPGAVVVETSAYDLFRALAGRRSADQMRAWTWSSDPAPYVALGLPYPFRFAETTVRD